MKESFYKLFVACVVASIVFGCAGRDAHPIQAYQHGDTDKSCVALEKEISYTKTEIERLVPETQKAGKNVALGVAGAFLLVPWFFMDLSKAEQVEINALIQRHNQLAVIAADKECGFDVEPIPDLDEMKKKHQQQDDVARGPQPNSSY